MAALILTCIGSGAVAQEQGRSVLESFYDATGGDNWRDNTNWKDDDAALGTWFGVAVGSNGRVSELNLRENELSGEIPTELGNLTSLQRLDLSVNELSGEIPTELGNLTSLQRLDLSINELNGEIPTELGNLTSLQRLDLSSHELSGTIPTELGNLTSLQRLDLSGNELSGTIPTELGNLTNLQRLDLSFNGKLSGEIPTELGNLTNLRRLDFDNNQLSGEIPTELGNLTLVEEFGLDGNQLSGGIPAELGNLTNVRFIDIDFNLLSGELPDELGNLTNLVHLDLRDNTGLTGELPLPLLIRYWESHLVVKVENTDITLPPPPSPSLTVDSTSLGITEGGGGQYAVRLGAQTTGDVTITVEVPSGTDVTVDRSELVFTIHNWDEWQTATVRVREDDDADDDPAVTLTHTISGGGYDSVSVPNVTVTITDDDTREVTASPTSLGITEGGEGQYAVRLATQPRENVTITVEVPSGTDVTVDRSELEFTIHNWDEWQTVTVRVGEDDDADDDPAVTLTHTISGGGYDSVSVPNVTVTITDDDTREVTASPTSLGITEGGEGQYAVRLATQPRENVTITVEVPSGTDVTVDRSELEFTIHNWDEWQTVTVRVGEDDDADDDPAVTLTHTISGGGYDSVSVPNVTVTITDDDTREVTASPTSLGITEGGEGQYAVRLATQPRENVTITVEVPSGTDVTVDRSELEFTIHNWDEWQTVTVRVGEDDDADDDPAVTLTHTISGGGYDSVSVPNVTVTITDDDTREVTASPTSLGITEGGEGQYAVRLATQPRENVTITVEVPSGTDVTVDRSELEFTIHNWDEWQTVTVRVGEDDDADDDPAVTLTHTISGGGYDSVSVPNVTVTITDDDTREVTASPTSLGITEGGEGQYAVRLATQPRENVTIGSAFGHGCHGGSVGA